MNPTLQPGVIVSFHDNLPVFPGIDEPGSDGCVSVDIAGGMCSVIAKVMSGHALTHLTIPLEEFGRQLEILRWRK